MTLRKIRKPRIILVGVGRFGRQHLRVLTTLEDEGLLALAAIVVKSARSAARLRRMIDTPVMQKITPALLSRADAAIIVTPSETHVRLAERFLSHVDVFVEKPLALTYSQAHHVVELSKKHRRILFVGHIFRYHPLFQTLATRLRETKSRVRAVEGRFISPLKTYRGENPCLENLHLFDMTDALTGKTPITLWRSGGKTQAVVDARYAGTIDAHFTLGWGAGSEKTRELTLFIERGVRGRPVCERWRADFVRSTFVVSREKSREWEDIETRTVVGTEPLATELRAFLSRISTREVARATQECRSARSSYPDGALGARVVGVAERAWQSGPPRRPRIAVVGGGIFGLTAALHLADLGDVTVFERNEALMREASFANQYRHHRGFHYLRSPETIRQIIAATAQFESFFRPVLVKNTEAFYAIARSGSKTSPSEFLRICDTFGLRYTEKYPDERFLNRRSVSCSVATDESVYDYGRLAQLLIARVEKKFTVSVRTSCAVLSCSLRFDGGKDLISRGASGERETERYDYVINATYANYNWLPLSLGIAPRNLEYRFKELVVVDLGASTPPTAVTVMDGPFATLVPTGECGIFTLGDVLLSVHETHETFSPERFQRWKRTVVPRSKEILKRSSHWIPAVADARIVESRFVTLPVPRESAESDARLTELTNHGFGCYSILEGKIVTAVSTARTLRRAIQNATT